jgi:hypothetical protein
LLTLVFRTYGKPYDTHRTLKLKLKFLAKVFSIKPFKFDDVRKSSNAAPPVDLKFILLEFQKILRRSGSDLKLDI